MSLEEELKLYQELKLKIFDKEEENQSNWTSTDYDYLSVLKYKAEKIEKKFDRMIKDRETEK